MTSHQDKAAAFLALHHADTPLLLPNAWDAGTAKIFAWMGFSAIATTSAGHAATLGRVDNQVTLDEALAHAADVVAATDLPVSSDFEHGFADDPKGVAKNIALAKATGLAGCSVEDSTGNADDPVYDASLAAERIAAAVETAHAGDVHMVIAAQAENFILGRQDLDDTIKRLHAYEQAGADVLYAPGANSVEAIREIVAAVDKPVNVLALPGTPTVAELAELGVKRISVGSAFHLVAMGATITAAREFLEAGTYNFWATAAPAFEARPAFT